MTYFSHLTFLKAVYSSILQLNYVDEFLSNMQSVFLSLHLDDIVESKNQKQPFPMSLDYKKFSDMYHLRLDQVSKDSKDSISNNLQKQNSTENEKSIISDVLSENSAPLLGTPDRSEASTPTKKKTRRGGGSKKKVEQSKKASTKQLRKWSEDGFAEYETEGQVLDYSTANDVNSSGADVNDEVVGDLDNYGHSDKNGDFMVEELQSLISSGMDSSEASSSSGVTKKAFGFLENIVGGRTLSPEVLEQTLEAMHTHLVKKNVASDVADHLCEAVSKSLVGSKTKSWTSVEATVRDAMSSALRRILTPNTSADLLREIHDQGKGNRPYVISVVGVNGVGKSTNLSKLAFWLLQNKFRVLVAACDTFRSGAVEQLKVHVDRLHTLTERLGSGEVQLFSEGYGKDSAVIAQKAVEYGQRNNFDVVLIDTAGRRHNDTRLMSSLAKFAQLAQPDKIIMVGEALVGTDSVSQAKNFNSSFGPGRGLDFFLISKCDTVGDMVGSLVNMTFATGVPVLFVGVGQTYTDLRRLSVEWAVSLLMS